MVAAVKSTALAPARASALEAMAASAVRVGLRTVASPSRRAYRKRELVFGRGEVADRLCLLESGRVKLYRLTPEGREIAVAIVEPGETFGEEAVVGVAHRTVFAEALETSRVRQIDRRELAEWLRGRPDVALEVTRNLWQRLGEVERQMENLAFRKVNHRLAALLVHWAEKYGETLPGGGIRLRIRVTHQEIASLIGSSRETVTLTLGQLVDAHLIAYDAEDRRAIVAPDLKRLAEFANSAG